MRRRPHHGADPQIYPDESFQEDALAFCRHLTQQNGELMGAAKIAIELSHDLPAHQAAQVERLTNSTLMLSPEYPEGMTRHISNIGKGKGL